MDRSYFKNYKSFKKLFDQQYSFLRTLKIIYILNNLLNYSILQKNKTLYTKYGLKKLVWSAISGKDFINNKAEPPWLDRTDTHQIPSSNSAFNNFNKDTRNALEQWPDNGFIILKHFFNEKEISSINNEVEHLITKGEAYLNYSGKQIMSAHKKSETIDRIIKKTELNHLLEFILGKKATIFQTINFLKGSEINPHSDFFHMSTFPVGNSIAVWIALEDVTEANGPLIYYPKSHKLPYIYSHDFAHKSTFFHIDKNLYAKYEKKIATLIETQGLKKQVFYAKKGDILIWHANLLHGGENIQDRDKTRKSMVIHYFVEDVIRYHEITQRPAIQENQ